MAGVSSIEFNTTEVYDAFALAVKESVTFSSSETLYPIDVITINGTTLSHIEVTFEQEGLAYSLGAHDATTAINVIRSRLTSSCNSGLFEALLHKLGATLRNAILLGIELEGIALTDSRIADFPLVSTVPTTSTTYEPSTSDTSLAIGTPLLVAIIVVSAFIACRSLQVLNRYRKRRHNISPQRPHSMRVSNVQVLPNY